MPETYNEQLSHLMSQAAQLASLGDIKVANKALDAYEELAGWKEKKSSSNQDEKTSSKK